MPRSRDGSEAPYGDCRIDRGAERVRGHETGLARGLQLAPPETSSSVRRPLREPEAKGSAQVAAIPKTTTG